MWTFLLLEKSQVKKVVENFCAYADTQFGKTIKKVSSDNSTEFMCLSSFFKNKRGSSSDFMCRSAATKR